MTKSSPRKRSAQIIQSFEAQAMRKRSLSAKYADSFSKFFGTFQFLVINLIVFFLWIIINLGFIPMIPIFDPYPFVLLITAVSLEAILLTTVVLISQNRQSQVGTLRDELQLQVELISEREITKALILLRRILKERGIEVKDAELTEMLESVDTSYIEKRLKAQIESSDGKHK